MTENDKPLLKLVATTRRPKRRKRHNLLAPRLPIVEVPEPPADMSVTGKTAWRELAAAVNSMGIYTEADVWAFEALAEWLGDLRAVQATLASPLVFDGVEVSAAGEKYYRCGDRQLIRPEWRFARSAERRFRQWAAKFKLPMTERDRLVALPTANAAKPLEGH
ncbi:MAG: P27 family phage terminase small subunit [Rhizomicrobium sp.]